MDLYFYQKLEVVQVVVTLPMECVRHILTEIIIIKKSNLIQMNWNENNQIKKDKCYLIKIFKIIFSVMTAWLFSEFFFTILKRAFS